MDNNFFSQRVKDFYTDEQIERAYEIAMLAADDSPPTYYGPDFEPHAWVILAVLRAMHS